MNLTKDQVKTLREEYKKYYENYMLCRKEYIKSTYETQEMVYSKKFCDYVKGLDVICALDVIYDVLGINTTDIERSVDCGK